MTLRIHRYELRPGTDRAFAAGSVRTGALLEVTADEGTAGYADLHPWPEFGHVPLEDQLASLANGEPTALVNLALRHARTDAEARRRGESLFAGLPGIGSHALLTSWVDHPRTAFDACIARGFTRIKLKIGRDPGREAPALNAVADLPLQWRLDANARLTAGSIRDFLEALSPAARARIEFLEDPCPYDPEAWTALSTTTGIPFALDWQIPAASPPWPGAAILVIKPASQDAFALARAAVACGVDIVVTHSMDHALGRAAALWTAMSLRQRHGAVVRDGGLDGSGLHAPDDFTSAWEENSPIPRAPVGTGFGFDTALAVLAWRELEIGMGRGNSSE